MRYLAIRGFDLEEYSVNMSKQQLNILLLCSFESTYVTQLRENIKNKCPYSKISLLTNERAKAGYLQKINLDEGEDIYSYRSSSVKFWFETDKIIRLLPKFDIIHSLWMEKPWGWHAKTLKSKTECLLCSVGGSDLYRDSKKKICKAYQLNLLNHSDWFSSENNETKEEFIRTYGRKYETIPHTINRFGVDIFDALINRKTTRIHNNRILDVPSDKIVICCGYNANPAHQHIDMIQSFQKFPQAMLEKLFFIFPMTYGVMDKGYIDKIKSSLNEFTNNYTILPIERFRDYFEVTAKYRIKRSGSGNVGKSRLKPVMDYISTHDYVITDSRIAGDKLFIVSPQQLHDHRFILCGIEYMFSLRGDEYELRKLSNTYNANVIFSIKHKASTPGMSEPEFIACLK